MKEKNTLQKNLREEKAQKRKCAEALEIWLGVKKKPKKIEISLTLPKRWVFVNEVEAAKKLAADLTSLFVDCFPEVEIKTITLGVRKLTTYRDLEKGEVKDVGWMYADCTKGPYDLILRLNAFKFYRYSKFQLHLELT